MATLSVLGSSSKGNCYVLRVGQDVLLLECGVALKNIKTETEKEPYENIYCVLSHHHKDHSKAYYNGLPLGISIYTTTEVKTSLGGNMERIIAFENKTVSNVGDFKIMPFENFHTEPNGDYCPCVGYLIYHPSIGKILFATDTYKIDYNFNNIDHILIECNYAESIIADKEDAQERVIRSHMSVENLKSYLNKWDLTQTKDITLLHLSERNGDKDLFKREIESTTGKAVNIAEKGVVLEW
ncbi:MAG: MBL fold metallo-hydrolase [Clostridium sp.]